MIPHLYEELGPEFARRLNGIFAVALWDEQSRMLLLVRDQLGVKPLYLHRTGSQLRFASEIKALLQDPAVPRQLDPLALDEHLTYRFTPAPRTLLAGVEKLKPATVLVWRDGVGNKQRYWDPRPPIRQDMSFDEAAEELREQLRRSVHRQMMSDRPIGVMLSGGVDSAAVVALMAEKSTQVKTFTVGFEGGGDADETGLARETADLLGTEHHELIVGHGDFAAELPAVIEMLEEPVGTSSALGFRQISRLAREHVPVLLSGQGADNAGRILALRGRVDRRHRAAAAPASAECADSAGARIGSSSLRPCRARPEGSQVSGCAQALHEHLCGVHGGAEARALRS